MIRGIQAAGIFIPTSHCHQPFGPLSYQPVNAPKLDTPIVLAHGMLGLLQGFFSETRIKHYFHGIPEWLREAGTEVIVTLVPGIGSIERRAEVLRKNILAATKGPIHVIGHSQGGLDSRHMITHLDMAKRVRSLTTIGTPHRGSPIADWGVSTADKAGVFQLIEKTTMDTQAFLDLRTENMAAFNESTPDMEGVRYYSVTGAGDPKKMIPTLRWCHNYIVKQEGANDGLVSTASAKWGKDVTEWPADHANQIGLFCGDHFDWEAHWAKMLERLE